jgi:hypothetical protein
VKAHNVSTSAFMPKPDIWVTGLLFGNVPDPDMLKQCRTTVAYYTVARLLAGYFLSSLANTVRRQDASRLARS